MFETLLLLFPIIFYYGSSIMKIYYFIKLINDYFLLRLYLKVTGKVNGTLVKYLYNDIINNGCFAIKFVQWIISSFPTTFFTVTLFYLMFFFHFLNHFSRS